MLLVIILSPLGLVSLALLEQAKNRYPFFLLYNNKYYLHILTTSDILLHQTWKHGLLGPPKAKSFPFLFLSFNLTCV